MGLWVFARLAIYDLRDERCADGKVNVSDKPSKKSAEQRSSLVSVAMSLAFGR